VNAKTVTIFTIRVIVTSSLTFAANSKNQPGQRITIGRGKIADGAVLVIHP
jgi:hypothetical protein